MESPPPPPAGTRRPGRVRPGPGAEAGRRPGRRRHRCPAGARPGARRTGRGERWPAPRPGALVRPRSGVSRREGRCSGGGGGAGVGARGRARVTHLLRRRGPRTRMSVNYWVRRRRRPGPAAPVGSVHPGGLPRVLISRSALLTNTPRHQKAQLGGRPAGETRSGEALNTAARASQPCDLPEKLLVRVTFKASLALATHPACNPQLPPGSWLSAGSGV
ncbi:translation initiation factor IF-2-like [Orcinus orca]|uniref:translation initiation factor IF-2-like n=1 Tax=Orcinus orca TaxID=9733 RepID=UPI0021116956|nr:translation initiation factor IF-2-like [Orcinus orca]